MPIHWMRVNGSRTILEEDRVLVATRMEMERMTVMITVFMSQTVTKQIMTRMGREMPVMQIWMVMV